MKKILTIAAAASTLMGCQAQPVNAPLTATVFTSLESAEVPPGTVIIVDFRVFDSVSGQPYDNVFVEVSALGLGSLIPSEAVGGVSNQLDPETGEAVVDWCDPEILSDSELESCLEDYYFQFSSYDLTLAPNYARLVTDNYGIARVFVIPFCGYIPESGGVACLPQDSEELEMTVQATITADIANIPITYN